MSAGDAIVHSGIYGYFALDDAPITPKDRAHFARPGVGTIVKATSNGIFQAIDRTHPAALDLTQDQSGLMAFVGYLDEPEDLVGTLGLSRETPPSLIVRAAVERWGDDASTHIRGEWSFVSWHSPSHMVTLLTSIHTRDLLFYAVHGGKVAIAPDARWLKRFDWVNSEIDIEGLLYRAATGETRRVRSDHSMIRGARRLPPSSRIVITPDKVRIGRPAALPAIAEWKGSFEDAMGETDALLRRIIKQKLAREKTVALTLSGGLDSSLIAMYVAQERSAGQNVVALTSAAPLGSRLQDEHTFATIVAERLELPIEAIRPPDEPNIYRPAVHNFEAARAPGCSTLHYLLDAFFETAIHHHATAVYEGGMGEMTLSYPFPLKPPPATIRTHLGNIRRALHPRQVTQPWPYCGFFPALAPALAESVPEAFNAAWASPNQDVRVYDRNEQWGYVNFASTMGEWETAVMTGQLRHETPFRDVRLLQSFGRFPAAIMEQGGLTRAPARALMRGHLPDSIRLRMGGCPGSPDYFERLKRQAGAAHDRIKDFRAVGIGEWLDIGWLDLALLTLQKRGTSDLELATKIQLTATFAEYLCWSHNINP